MSTLTKQPTAKELAYLADQQAYARRRYHEDDADLIRESLVIEWALREVTRQFDIGQSLARQLTTAIERNSALEVDLVEANGALQEIANSGNIFHTSLPNTRPKSRDEMAAIAFRALSAMAQPVGQSDAKPAAWIREAVELILDTVKVGGGAAEMRERAAKYHDKCAAEARKTYAKWEGVRGSGEMLEVILTRIQMHEVSATAIRALPLTPEGK